MHYLVDFINTASEDEINNYLTSFGASVLKVFSSFDKVYHIDTPVEPPANSIVELSVRDDDHNLQLLNTVIVADKNYGTVVTDGSVPTIEIANDDQNWWKFYSLKSPDLEAPSHTINRRGTGSVVYVLDSGIELTHDEFTEADVQNLFSFNNDFTDTKGHGTAIASLIAGKKCGLTNATVKSVKIFDKNQSTKQSDMLNALDAIIADFGQSTAEHAIVNCSWSIPKNEYLEAKIQYMINSGIGFVAAAGNNGQPIDNITPASMTDVITIGSYNNALKPSDFSSYTDSGLSLTQGSTNHGALDGWAPGEKIYAAGLNNTYHYVAGTSIAAGIHSSAIAYNMSLSGYNPMQNKSMVEFYSSYSLGRKNMLDLSDPKYQNSVNLISTVADSLPEFGRGAPITQNSLSISGMPFVVQLFNPKVVTQLEVLDSLPNGWVISTMGRLFGTAPIITDRVSVNSISMQATYDDNTQEQFIFKLITQASDFNKETETSGDPILDIVLLGSVNCFPGGCYGPDPGDQCYDNCFGATQCYYLPNYCATKINYCECTF